MRLVLIMDFFFIFNNMPSGSSGTRIDHATRQLFLYGQQNFIGDSADDKCVHRVRLSGSEAKYGLGRYTLIITSTVKISPP